MRLRWLVLVLIILAAVGVGGAVYWRYFRGALTAVLPANENIAERIGENNSPLIVAPGFSLSVFAQGFGNPRVLVSDPAGALLVSVPGEGKVVVLKDGTNDGVGEVTDVLTNLDAPHGLALRCRERCELFVAEKGRLVRYVYDAATTSVSDERTVAALPASGVHTRHSIAVRPAPHDNELLVTSGSTCNVCREEDERRGTVLAVNSETGAMRIFSRGLRNAPYLAVRPGTDEVWVTEMGRDLLGDDIPPDEINILQEGANYGWPICYGQNIHDTDFDKNTYIRNPCLAPFETPSHIDIPAHSAPLGLAFIPDSWPEAYRGDLLVAYHGSWNRTEPTGYSVVRHKLAQNGSSEGTEHFISDWLQDGNALGRPSGLLFVENVLYIADDKAGVIYRVIPST